MSKCPSQTPIGAIFAILLSVQGDAQASPSPRWIDVHMHLDGQVIRSGSEALRPNGPPPRTDQRPLSPRYRRPLKSASVTRDFLPAAENLVAMMDRLGIAKAVIMPPPESPNQAGAYTYGDLLPVIRRYPERLILAAGGGELNPMIIGTDSGAVTEGIREAFLKEAERIVGDGARAFGEMSALHFSFSERHSFKQAPPDHPLFCLLADIAARHGMPIDLHIEAAETDETVSRRLTSRSRANPAVVSATIPGLERLLQHNRGANIVWQHGGWDNTGHATPDLFRRLFSRHANFYCALKVVRRDYEPFRSANSLCDDSLRLQPEWRALILEFPDRFLIGADEFILAAGASQRKGPPSLADTWSILEQLPEEVRERVGRTNAVGLYGLEGP